MCYGAPGSICTGCYGHWQSLSERTGKKKLNLLLEKDGVWKDGEYYGPRSGCWEGHSLDSIMINANILVGGTSRKAAVVLRKVAEGLRFACGQYGSFTVFAVSLRFTAFRRILAEKLNISASTRGTYGRSRKRAVHRRYICGFLRFSAVVESQRTAAWTA